LELNQTTSLKTKKDCLYALSDDTFFETQFKALIREFISGERTYNLHEYYEKYLKLQLFRYLFADHVPLFSYWDKAMKHFFKQESIV
ncbi:hypothetical protein ABTM48_20405, partial [Acinetobacter baumannii]